MPEILFNGPEGKLEGRYHHNPDSLGRIAILLHPHPKQGGTMNNRVIQLMYQIFIDQGFSVLRFNFRGVGKSLGTFDNGVGELADAAAALDWIQTHNPNFQYCWIGGFSFGAWISMQLLMRRPNIDGFISLSVPAHSYDFSFLAPCPSSGLVVHGTKDASVPCDAVDRLVAKLALQKKITIAYEKIKDANHYYGNHQDELKGLVSDYLVTALAASAVKKVEYKPEEEEDNLIESYI